MRSTFALFLTCLAALVIELTNAQTTHVVKVGDTGSFYDPQVTTARAGDVVSFQWTSTFHSVTQSSFDNPCTPLPGGFDSGITGNPPQKLLQPEWNLTITDDTQPIWFFCKVSAPVLHCTQGMVGAINAEIATGNHSYNNFSLHAKLITSPALISPGPPVLTGVGAFAMSTPVPLFNLTTTTSTIPTSSSISSSTTSSSTTPPTATQTQQDTSSPAGLSAGEKGGIAGGSAGALILLILLVLLFMSYRRGRRYRKEATAIQELRSKRSHDMSHIDRLDMLYPGAGPDSLPHNGSQHVLHLQHAQAPPSIVESLERDSTSPSINIKELAAEIARNMRQDSERSGIPPQELTTVPEQLVADSVSRAASSRAESGRVRQLPRPPQTRADVRSVDTLPAYVIR